MGSACGKRGGLGVGLVLPKGLNNRRGMCYLPNPHRLSVNTLRGANSIKFVTCMGERDMVVGGAGACGGYFLCRGNGCVCGVEGS